MKKLTLLFLLAFYAFSHRAAYAQDTLKTSAKNWSVELNVNPFQGQISLNNSLNQIKVRYFASEKLAYRFAFNINDVRKENGQSNAYGTNPIETTDLKKSTTLGLNFGFETHFSGTHRLSPYIGAEIAFGYKEASETIDTKQSTTEIKGAWQNMQVVQYNNGNGTYYTTTITNTEIGFKSYGINLITGFDYYISKNFFFGYEMLFGYNYINYNKVETTVTPKPDPDNQNTIYNSYPDQTAKEHSIGPKIINGIRLGYTF